MQPGNRRPGGYEDRISGTPARVVGPRAGGLGLGGYWSGHGYHRTGLGGARRGRGHGAALRLYTRIALPARTAAAVSASGMRRATARALAAMPGIPGQSVPKIIRLVSRLQFCRA